MDCKKSGALIRRLRLGKDMTQSALAEILGVSVQAVSKWERGLSVPDSDMLVSLSEALETPVSALLGENVSERKTDELKAICEKLEVINLQLAQRKTTK
ncbi:MAG: helix-turn-helix domain-containing protein [Acutalibacteraceae bacterium]